jgi:hypothetical protein
MVEMDQFWNGMRDLVGQFLASSPAASPFSFSNPPGQSLVCLTCGHRREAGPKLQLSCVGMGNRQSHHAANARRQEMTDQLVENWRPSLLTSGDQPVIMAAPTVAGPSMLQATAPVVVGPPVTTKDQACRVRQIHCFL